MTSHSCTAKSGVNLVIPNVHLQHISTIYERNEGVHHVAPSRYRLHPPSIKLFTLTHNTSTLTIHNNVNSNDFFLVQWYNFGHYQRHPRCNQTRFLLPTPTAPSARSLHPLHHYTPTAAPHHYTPPLHHSLLQPQPRSHTKYIDEATVNAIVKDFVARKLLLKKGEKLSFNDNFRNRHFKLKLNGRQSRPSVHILPPSSRSLLIINGYGYYTL